MRRKLLQVDAANLAERALQILAPLHFRALSLSRFERFEFGGLRCGALLESRACVGLFTSATESSVVAGDR